MTFQNTPWLADEGLESARPLALRAVVSDEQLENLKSFHLSNAERKSFAAAALIHVLLFLALSVHLGSPPKPPQTGMQVSFIELGDVPPNGDPNGDSAPPRPNQVETVEAEDVPVEPSDKPVVEDAEPVSEVPSETATPAETVDGSPPQPSSAAFSELTGTGTLALGAKTHGTGGGLDGDLAAAVGNAIATQIKACWDAPRVNLPDDLSISMTVAFHRDGSVYGEPTFTKLVDEEQVLIEDPGPFELAAVEAVKKCAPIKLPPNLYAYWSAVDVQIFSSVVPEDLPAGPTPA